MSREIKTIIKRSLLSGGIFALFLEGFKWINGENLNIWRFLLYFAVFGIGTGYKKYFDLIRKKRGRGLKE